MIDKQIHRDELKLRILLTNGCNQQCKFCLNDFQEKPTDKPLFIPLATAFSAIHYYEDTLKNIVPIQIYLSGGEPTLHPFFIEIASYAKARGRTNLNTNGTTLSNKYIRDAIKEFIDITHIGTYKIDNELAEHATYLNADIQCVHTKKNSYVTKDFIQFYIDKGLHVKIFMNFWEDDVTYYHDFISDMTSQFPTELLSFRHTGIQENRGPGCNGCDKKCITLKAAWLFPDQGISTCPQLYKAEKAYPFNEELWKLYFKQAYKFHTVI